MKYLSVLLLTLGLVSCQKIPSKTSIISKELVTAKPLNFKSIVNTPLDSMLAEAKSKGMLVFVDCYATWCGPCKYMDNNVFNQASIVKKFSKDFLNLKVDVEAFDGVNVSLNYKVDSFPTYLFLDGDGKVVHRLEGVFTIEGMLQEADFALAQQKTP